MIDVNPYQADLKKHTPRYNALKQAFKDGYLSTVQSIIEVGDSENPDPSQPVPFAQERIHHFEVAHYLIRQAGAVIWQAMPFHAADSKMSVDAFEFLLQEGWDINSPVYGSNQTGLSRVVTWSLPLTKWFLEHDADPNFGPHPHHPFNSKKPMVQYSGSVLNVAACGDSSIAVAVIDLLIHHGARLEDSLPSHLAAECGEYKSSLEPPVSNNISELHVQDDSDLATLHKTSSARIPVLKHLLELGYDPNASNDSKFGAFALGSPLHWAVRAKRADNARFFLENGADPRGKDRCGRNALEAAEGTHEIEMVIKEFM